MAPARKLHLVLPEAIKPKVVPVTVPRPSAIPAITAERPASEASAEARRSFRPALIASVLIHLGAAAAMLWGAETGEERAAGGTDALVILEGASVELLDSMPGLLVAATRVEATEPAEEVEQDAAAEPEPDEAATGTAAVAPATPPLQGPALDPEPAAITPHVAALAAVAAQPASPVAEPAPTSAEPAVAASLTDEPASERSAEEVVRPVETAGTVQSLGAPATRADEAASADAADDAGRKPVMDDEAAVAADLQPREPVEDAPARPAAVAEAKSRPEPPKPAARPAPSRAAPAMVANLAASGPAKGVSGAGGISTANAGKASSSSYRSRLVGHLRRYQTYPAAAASRRLSGTVVVTFSIDAGGRVTSARVGRSSGQSILDSAAIGMVRRASPFPPIPAGLGASITVSAPIRFAR